MEAAAVFLIILFCLWVSARPCSPAYKMVGHAKHSHYWIRKGPSGGDIHDGPWTCYCGARKDRLSTEELFS